MKLPLKPGLLVAEAAERLGVTPKVIWRLIEQNQLDCFVVGPKLFFIPEQALERYIAARDEANKK